MMTDAKGRSEVQRHSVYADCCVKPESSGDWVERLKACEARHKEYVYAVDIDQREAEKQCDQLTADLASVTQERDNLEAFVKKNACLIADRDRLKEAVVEINHAWNTKSHDRDGIDTFHFWYAAHIEMIEALTHKGDAQ